MRVWWAILLVAVPLAGCTEGTADSGEATAGAIQSQDVVRDADTDSGNGSVMGRVFDDVNYSISGAHVSLLGTPFFAATNATGGFLIEDVPAGAYRMRVDPPAGRGYVSVEDAVDVEAGAAVTLQVLVPRASEVPPGYRAHVHDFFGAGDRYMMFDQDVEFTNGDAQHDGYVPLYGPNYSDTTQRNNLEIPVQSPEGAAPAIVVPGTGKIHLSLDWGDGVTASKLGLWVKVPGEEELRRLDAHGPGEPWTLDVVPEAWDSGHQPFTFWRFFLASDFAAASQRADGTPVVIDGPVHVTLELEKGDQPPLDPPHRDWWEDNTTIEHTIDAHKARTFNLPAGVLVPPGTSRMRVEIHMDFSDATAVGKATYDTVDDWEMRFRTADQNPAVTAKHQYQMAGTKDPCGDFCYAYEFDLAPRWADGFYQQNSNWEWEAFVDPPALKGSAITENNIDTSRGSYNSLHLTLYKRDDFV